MPSVGFRILPRQPGVAQDLVSLFKEIPVANISDCMARMTAAGPLVRPMHDGTTMAGVAFTVKSRAGDNLMLHKALDLAAPGDVIVVECGGDTTNSMLGELMMTYAQHRGLAGIVMNGAIRDSHELRRSSFPVFAAGVTHRGPYKNGPGEINVPIAIDGMVVQPGDLIVGDADGVLCIPRDSAADIYAKAKAKNDLEKKQFIEMRDGTVDRSWVDKVLIETGCDMG